MSRWTMAFAAMMASACWSSPASAQIFIQGGASIGGMRSSFGIGLPGGYTYVAPSYYPQPLWTYDGFFLGYGGTTYPGYYWPRPLRMSEMPGSPLTPPPDALPAQRSPLERSPLEHAPLAKPDPALRNVVPSSPAARAKALDLQAEGDHYVRRQQYQRAYSAYRQALGFADDLPALHLRYGIVFVVLGRYDRAAMEFRRATHVDPDLPRSEFTLESLFGPDSQLVRGSLLSRVTKWVGEDVTDPDRQYILGVLLHFNQDERAQELFTAAYHLTAGAEHIAAYLPREAPNGANLARPDRSALPPAPQPRERAVDAPPKPGLEDDAAPPKAKQPPPKFMPPAKPKPKPEKSEDSTSFEGPILLPPAPK